MTFLWFYFILFSLAAIIFALAIYLSTTTKSYYLSIVVITLSVFLLFLNWNNLNQIRSEPLTYLSDTFIILKHLETKDYIYLWVVNEEYDYPITVVIPWDDETAEALREAEEEIEQLGGIEAELDGNNFNPGQLELYGFDHSERIRK